MENQDKKKAGVLLKDACQDETTISLKKKPVELDGIIKKAVLYFALGIAFIGCMFLIFGSSEDDEKSLKFNDAVPQASNAEMQSDKQKAYEQELMEKRANEKKEALMTLSDYWKNDSSESQENEGGDEMQTPEANELKLRSSSPDKGYQAIRNTLGNFYKDDSEKDELRRELEIAKEKLAARESQQNPLDDQLALMERSYQMAAKYLPQAVEQETPKDSMIAKNSSKENIRPVYSTQKNVVSSLYRESADPEFMMHWNEQRNREFNTVKSNQEVPIVKNSIRACVHETQTIILGSSAKLRLLEPVRIDRIVIPAGTLLTASVKLDGGRLGLAVNSVEWQGSIFPVDITIYDLDGQRGLYLPYSPEVSALKEFASGMGNSAGTNITLTSSAGQQLAADLTKGVVQGVSGYFSKKTKVPKITLKAGHELLLVPKE